MRKTLIGLTVGMLAVLLLVTPGLVAAKGGHGGGGGGSTSFNVVGTIKVITCPSKTEEGLITVERELPETGEVTAVLDSSTRYKQCTGEEGSTVGISCTVLTPGLRVRIVGNGDDTLIAWRVILLLEE